jgi:hypothetical protein
MGEAAAPSTALGAAGGFGSESAGAVGGGSFSAAGYIDSAIPLTQFRLRFDSAYNDNRPDRADFFYPKCGCFKAAGVDPNAPGPASSVNPTAATRKVDYQELSSYLEIAVNPRLSGFAEVPVRWVDIAFSPVNGVGVPNDNHKGLSDVNFGFKYAALYTADTVLTFQLRVYSPTGDSTLGLGRNNWNLEPALLAYQRLGECFFLEAELRDFIPVASADDFAGNVLRYGVGLSCLVYNAPSFRVQPVTELVGWTVLSGQEGTDSGAVLKASGDTIVNAKFGLRLGFGQLTQPGNVSKSDVYVGYGRALTGDVWYKDILRLEWRYRF